MCMRNVDRRDQAAQNVEEGNSPQDDTFRLIQLGSTRPGFCRVGLSFVAEFEIIAQRDVTGRTAQ